MAVTHKPTSILNKPKESQNPSHDSELLTATVARTDKLEEAVIALVGEDEEVDSDAKSKTG